MQIRKEFQMNEFSSAGITVKYAVEATSGTRPTTGYTTIPCIKSTPDFNASPNNLEVTDLSDTEWKRFIPGLKDVGGSLAFTANLTTEFKAAWVAMCAASDTAIAADKAMWIEIAIPNFDSFYFAGIPTPLGLKGFSVDSIAEVDAYVAPNQILGWATAST